MTATLLLLALVAPALHAGAGQTPVTSLPGPRTLVVPFETPARDGRTYWLGEAVAMLIADDMNARGVGAIPRDTRERAYEQLHLPVNTALSRATVIKVGELVGANQVIVGEVRIEGDALTVKAQPIRIDIGRAGMEVTERGNLSDLFAIVEKTARRVAPGGAPGGTPSGRAPSLHAFELFVKGLLAERPASQAEFLKSAVVIDPRYDRARLALWEVLTGQGDHAAALTEARAIAPDSTYSRRAKFAASVSLIALKQYDEAFTVLKAVQDAASSPAVLNNLGIVQIRRGGTAETGKPIYFLTKAAEADPDDPDVLFNLGYAYALDRDPQGAIYWLREELRRNPVDGDAHMVLATALEQAGSAVEAGRERALASQLSSRYGYADASSHAMPPRGLERIKQNLDSVRAGSVGQTLAATAQRDQQNVAQFHLDRGRRFFEAEQDREAMAELRRAVFLSPYEAEAHLLIGRIHLRAGRPREAIDALKLSIWSRDTAPAHVALGEAYLTLKDTASARAEAQKALALDPGSREAKALLERLIQGNQ